MDALTKMRKFERFTDEELAELKTGLAMRVTAMTATVALRKALRDPAKNRTLGMVADMRVELMREEQLRWGSER